MTVREPLPLLNELVFGVETNEAQGFIGEEPHFRAASTERECNARGLIHPEFDDGEEAVGLVV